MKEFNYPNSGFSFLYPENWNIEIDKNLISTYDPEKGVGSLQFSVYYPENCSSIDIYAELNDYLANKHDNFNVTRESDYASCYLVVNSSYWKYWLFIKETLLIFATYNCVKEDIGKEDEIINNIINSCFLPT